MSDLSAAEVIELLDLKPHPEGGHFRETFRDRLKISNTRAASSAIYFLLARGQRSCWHKIDAVEIWHYHAGASLELQVALHDTGPTTRLNSRTRPHEGRKTAGHCPSAGLAVGSQSGRLDVGRLHGCAGIRVCGLGGGARRMDPALPAAHQTMNCPPLAERVEPVISPASSAARNTTQRAISSGSPRRPIGI